MMFYGFHRIGLPNTLRFVALIVLTQMACVTLIGQEVSRDDSHLHYFETVIRPALHEHCLACHNVGKRNGGLALDSRAGWMEGGDSGPTIVAGDPSKSLLLGTIKHQVAGLEMPSKAPKLDDNTIKAFEKWILDGAVDPRDQPEKISIEEPSHWDTVASQRAKWWCWQMPVTSVLAGPEDSSLADSIDFLIEKKLKSQLVVPSEQADPRTLIRRLSYQLKGLPPTQAEVEEFQQESSEESWMRIVDRMLATEEFAEHWARHWMDVVRYAETHGSEDDAYIPFVYRYRDYMVRNFRDDVGIDRVIREHIAGDMIEPRWNQVERCNESLIGLAFLRFVEFSQTPVDVKREEIIVIDSQIDAIGKAFQGITISCARCHDHKFDPISDEDYYALYGILRSTRTGMRVIDDPESFQEHNDDLLKLQKEIKAASILNWIADSAKWEKEIASASSWVQQHWKEGVTWEAIQKEVPNHPWTIALTKALCSSNNNALRQVALLLAADDEAYNQASLGLQDNLKRQELDSANRMRSSKTLFDLKEKGIESWRVDGAGIPKMAIEKAGFLSVLGGLKQPFSLFLEPGFHTNLLSDRHGGVIRSPDFVIEDDEISLLCRGTGNARARLVMENFQGDSLLFDTINPSLNSNEMQWITMSIRPQWKGLRAHVEVLTRDFKPYIGIIKDPQVLEQSDGRSSFGLMKVVAHRRGGRPNRGSEFPLGIVEKLPESRDEMIRAMVMSSSEALERLKSNEGDSADVRWVNSLIDAGVIDWNRNDSDSLARAMERYRELESRIPIPRLVPGVYEDNMAIDQEYLPRGDHKRDEASIQRRYLSVLGSNETLYQTSDSGRLQLANEIVSAKNPLTARVYVNRVWNWLFGNGLTSSVDNFGRMGSEPIHPELLDFLAIEFMAHGWSTKKLIRSLVMTQTWRRSAEPTASAMEFDPSNRLWSHAMVRRVDAESIRDTMLMVSGALRRPDKGLGTRNFYRMVLEANKQSPPGPLDGEGRRSLYLEVRRNFPNDFLLSFDFPRPAAPVGKRNSTNVPAQSLTLLNDPFVVSQAKRWGERLIKDYAEPERRVEMTYQALLNRSPSDSEMRSALGLVEEVKRSEDELAAWATLTHAMFNLKEAIFLR